MYVSYDNEEQELVNVIRVKRVAGARRWRAQAQLGLGEKKAASETRPGGNSESSQNPSQRHQQWVQDHLGPWSSGNFFRLSRNDSVLDRGEVIFLISNSSLRELTTTWDQALL